MGKAYHGTADQGQEFYKLTITGDSLPFQPNFPFDSNGPCLQNLKHKRWGKGTLFVNFRKKNRKCPYFSSIFLEISWQKTKIDYNPYKRWVDYWRED